MTSNMILCVGTSGSGKSTLLQELQFKSTENALAESGTSKKNTNKPQPEPSKNTIPTVGTNLVNLIRPRLKKNQTAPPDSVVVREVGGTLAPLWHTYIEPGRTKAILYTVDSSSPECIGAATIHLVDLIHRPGVVDSAHILIVFTKTDMPSSRSLSELMSLMRLSQIASVSRQNVNHVTFNLKEKENLQHIYDWCVRFAGPKGK